MRLCTAAALLLLSASSAWAQDQNTVAVPPPPPLVAAPPPVTIPSQNAYPPSSPPPGLVETPVPPAPTASGSADLNSDAPPAPGAVPATPPPPDVAPVIPNTWTPGTNATIGVLDKVDGGTSQITIPVGGEKTVGDLQLSVQACVTRPPDQLPDDAVFLSVQPAANAAAPLYRGWMVRSAPGATVVGDAGETFRIIGCV